MAYLEWNDSLSVNVTAIDLQHQELLRMLNDLHDAMAAGEGTAVLGEIVDGLIVYTRTHFSNEEGYFEASGYPDTEAHKRQHREFVEKVADFKQGLAEGRLMMSLDVMDFLGDWLVQHIQGSDAAYAPYLSR